jgi:hypothetical protein
MRLGLSLVIAFVCAPMCVVADDALLQNGDFATWQGDTPTGWTVDIGARNGQGGTSILRKLDEGGILLEGDAGTAAWKSVTQSFAVEPGSAYRLTFEARAHNVRRQGRQYDNCYVGILVKDAAGKRVGLAVHNVEDAEWTTGSVIVSAGAGAKTADATIFLSKTGTLEVRNVTVVKVDPRDSFDLLVEDMDRHYSFFELKGVNWCGLAGRYRERALAAKDAAAFAAVLTEMLATLEDVHITIQTPDGQPHPTFARTYASNANFRHVARQLEDVQQIGRIGFVGTTADGFGYVAVGSLGGDEDTFAKLEQAVVDLLNAPGLIVDVRGNNGGDERRARRIVGLLTDKPLVYAKSRFRSGPAHSDFGPAHERVVEPAGNSPYKGPVVGLIGPGCISSGEAMAMMVDALPSGTLLGQPTAGASGNPAPLALPNGVTVSYSRWLNLNPDETHTEGKGIIPDEVIKHDPSGDPTFDAAVKSLKERVKR